MKKLDDNAILQIHDEQVEESTVKEYLIFHTI